MSGPQPHAPALQNSPPVALQVVPHAPQFLESICKFVHPFEQVSGVGVTHVGVVVIATQLPLVNCSPVGQVTVVVGNMQVPFAPQVP